MKLSKEMVEPLLHWYQENARKLPWRSDATPYHVWVSEIMLQQTRVEAVIDYYYRFMEALPTIQDLAMIDEEKLLKLWEGLGYYSRVRNLQKTAQLLCRDNEGKLPENYDELIKLPGIGPYTAGAISSIAYQKKVAAVDGNVLRVVSRLSLDPACIDEERVKKMWKEEIEKVMPTESGMFNQAMMETFRTYCQIDAYGRLHVISSTQIVFHVRRILANALGIPKSKIRVEKPRIGGGFGAKQTVVAEIYPAFVTWMTKKPSRIIYTRTESQIAASPRHEMEVTVKIGAMNDGTIKAIDVYTLSNTGAFGEHGPTTVGLSGHKSIPLYSNNLEAFKFSYDVVYTNTQAAGAYRGYGATQGTFAVESIVNELAARLNIDPVVIREKNMVRQGQTMPAYYNEVATSCTLDKCMEHAKKLFDWENKSKVRELENGKIRSAGVAMAMQGSGISGVDVGSATIKLEDEGYYTLSIGAADMGTGCDTILAQMAAESLECDIDKIIVFGADSDASPYDSGSYASSTTYVTGKAVLKACEGLKENLFM